MKRYNGFAEPLPTFKKSYGSGKDKLNGNAG